ncbi:hypothetical protein RI129_007510 [Pyrocoelia pectoralis]|uniref:A-kinase anchor protein 2 C-terminal domain-containing protein n=1 Tax=Pyrocoelia pectoralis TaxID=417401 RepID=A0AAN7V860_9COLE
MPSTKDATLQLIQREINEVMEREHELRANYNRTTSSLETTISNGVCNGAVKPPLDRSKSVPYHTNGNTPKNAIRLFTRQNIPTKGVMQRFIKSRGKMNAFINSSKNQPPSTPWTDLEEIIKPAKVSPGIHPRNGFVPVEEKIRREFDDMEKRERELRFEREKSHPDLLAALDSSSSSEPERKSLRSTMSVLQLNDFENDEETSPTYLKGAKSLSDLCDIDNDEEVPARFGKPN